MFRYLILYRIVVWAKDKEVTDVTKRWEHLKMLVEDAEFSLLQAKK